MHILSIFLRVRCDFVLLRCEVLLDQFPIKSNVPKLSEFWAMVGVISVKHGVTCPCKHQTRPYMGAHTSRYRNCTNHGANLIIHSSQMRHALVLFNL